MRVFDGIADLETAVGTHLGYSDWHTIDQAQIDAFATATGDHQWIHVDPVQAAEGPFGGTIAHGFLVLSLTSMLCWQVYTVDGVSMTVNYGSDKLRFTSPVPVDSRVRAGVELTAVEASSAGFKVSTRVTLEREGGDKPACVADVLSVVVA
ncbi:MaoC family dehydratase [Arthrobacter sp. BE255]|uniref:MaoC family dehydratase n=1 Tax=Arthrobacter sp. BE255 TaxID=2817721 RepID=UPI002858988F|nr:MaoC family dehydratase [Arthrobacter sp. BE255]MDR7159116.1 acyl dehydratase [Arthrobacter sp. BE255]